jgi:serine protease Do
MRLLSIALLATASTAILTAQPATRDLRAMSDSFQKLVEQVNPAVVQIVTRGYTADESLPPVLRTRSAGGSGVIVDGNGYVVTNAHVIGVARRVQVMLPLRTEERARAQSVLKPAGKTVDAKVLGLDRETDVAVLKVEEKDLPHLKFGDSEALRNGQLAFAFGSPFGLDNSVTMGVISSVARQVRPDDSMIYIQTDASINPGNSGGPLVDANGAFIGLNTFILSTSGSSAGLGFAVPSNVVRAVYEQIVKHGRVRRGQIGIQAQTLTPPLARALGLGREWGVVVGDVVPGGSAAAAGIQVRDVILSLNGKPLENARQFGVNIYQNAGQTVKLEILRGTETITSQVAVLERPKDPDRILSLISSEDAIVPRLGILAVDLDERVTPLLPSLRKLSGVVVAGALREPASAEDLQMGDVIYELNNAKIGNVGELKKALQTLKAGDPVALQIERLGQLQYVLVSVE